MCCLIYHSNKRKHDARQDREKLGNGNRRRSIRWKIQLETVNISGSLERLSSTRGKWATAAHGRRHYRENKSPAIGTNYPHPSPPLARCSTFADNRNSLIRHRLIDPLENYRRWCTPEIRLARCRSNWAHRQRPRKLSFILWPAVSISTRRRKLFYMTNNFYGRILQTVSRILINFRLMSFCELHCRRID